MKYLFTNLIMLPLAMLGSEISQAQNIKFSEVKAFERKLGDVSELTDTAELKIKLKSTEELFREKPDELNKVRLGIIYHEAALNFSFLAKAKSGGYAQKSFDLLTQLFNSAETTKELLPFIASYRASSLSLIAAETKKLNLLSQSFLLFQDAVEKYASISYMPEFLRGSVAENLPWFLSSKRRYARLDFESIIQKQALNKEYADWKVMSFTYYAWAKQHRSKKHNQTALSYLERAIALDPDYKAGRLRAEELRSKIL